MSGVQRFEDLVAWQKARELCRCVYETTRTGPLARDFGLAAQMQRAAVSVMSNVAEGFERHRRQEFHQFLSVAKSSCAEVRSHLYVALDTGYLAPGQFESMNSLAQEVARLVGALRASVQRRIDSDKEY